MNSSVTKQRGMHKIIDVPLYAPGRLAITGNHQLYLPKEIQKMLEGAGRIRIQLV